MADLQARVISIPVIDVDRVEAFYVEKLGRTVAVATTLGDQRWGQVQPSRGGPAVTLVICRGDVRAPPPPRMPGMAEGRQHG